MSKQSTSYVQLLLALIKFFDKPFMSLNVNHVVPPLRFDTGSCEVLIEASRLDFQLW